MTACSLSAWEETLQWLLPRSRMGIRPGLEGVRELMEAAGIEAPPAVGVQIAGTNGKGTTTHFLAGLLSREGFRTGRYVSPHLISVVERIAIDGQFVSQCEMATAIGLLRPHAEACKSSFFEILTAAAAHHFGRAGAQAAAWETGIGGRWDAVTALPMAGLLLTGVDLDHTELLGDTVEAIWEEKIAAARPGCWIVSAESRRGLRDRLREKAAELGASLFEVETGPQHEDTAARLATAGATMLLNRTVAPPTSIERDRWRPAGRRHLLNTDPPLMLDIAHNPAACAALARDILNSKEAVGLVSCLLDKDLEGIAKALAPAFPVIHVFGLPPPRGRVVTDLQAAFPGSVAHPDLATALKAAQLDATKRNMRVVATGSAQVVGAVLRLLYTQGDSWPSDLPAPDPWTPQMG